MGARRWTRTSATALVVAVAWGVLLVLGAFVVTVPGTSGADTLVGANGYGVLPLVLAPLVAALAVAWSLADGRHRRRGWAVTSALCVLTVLSLLSVGVFFLPSTIALLVACAATPRASGATAPAAS